MQVLTVEPDPPAASTASVALTPDVELPFLLPVPIQLEAEVISVDGEVSTESQSQQEKDEFVYIQEKANHVS